MWEKKYVKNYTCCKCFGKKSITEKIPCKNCKNVKKGCECEKLNYLIKFNEKIRDITDNFTKRVVFIDLKFIQGSKIPRFDYTSLQNPFDIDNPRNIMNKSFLTSGFNGSYEKFREYVNTKYRLPGTFKFSGIIGMNQLSLKHSFFNLFSSFYMIIDEDFNTLKNCSLARVRFTKVSFYDDISKIDKNNTTISIPPHCETDECHNHINN